MEKTYIGPGHPTLHSNYRYNYFHIIVIQPIIPIIDIDVFWRLKVKYCRVERWCIVGMQSIIILQGREHRE